MSQVLIGTENGLFQLKSDNTVVEVESSPQRVKFLATKGLKVYALTREDSLWCQTENAPWKIVHPKPVKEEVWSFAIDPHLTGRLYLGVSPALLYQSDDGGKNWKGYESIRQIPGYEQWTFPPPPHIPHVRDIAPDPNRDSVYIGVEEGGIYISHNQGETWDSLNEGLYWDVHTVVPVGDGLRLYATTGNGFYRSDDGGQHWRRMMQGLERNYTVACVVSKSQTDLVFVAAAASPPPTWALGANAGLYRSLDGGEHWQQLEQGLPSKFDVMVRVLTLDTAGRIFVGAGDQLFTSEDLGENWQLVAEKLPNIQALAIV
ncbi:MAG: hypothetical protein V7K94_29790 [Nostoc sp.]|uniref:WD40/YVTN/BNR-like repeat-containing protein n=1 Tax=Nostoc sp. TaxID=1180 RepID=UPI002FF9BA45